MIWFRRKVHGLRSPHQELRTELLCEQTLAELASRPEFDPDTAETRFVAAQASILVGDRSAARRRLHELLALPTVTTQLCLQAWNALRELDELPSAAAAAEVRGVVVELGTDLGLETLAAFEDQHIQLLLGNGEVRSVRSPDRTGETARIALFFAARAVVAHTHPHRGARELPPQAGHASIRVLTFAGTHVGLGPIATLAQDPIGGPLLAAAKTLREELVAAQESGAS